jgi:hypothetical protein
MGRGRTPAALDRLGAGVLLAVGRLEAVALPVVGRLLDQRQQTHAGIEPERQKHRIQEILFSGRYEEYMY